MGILNTTPDSFYDRGRFKDAERAKEHALALIEDGADVVDVGGEKAGPGPPISEEEELRRVIPIIERIRREAKVPISVDTLKPTVARAALEAGADIINSIGAFQDPQMRRLAARRGAAIIVMHIQGRPRIPNPNPHYENVVSEVVEFLQQRVDLCISEGVAPNRILVDPGPDFGKTTEQDIELLKNLDHLTALPYPLVLAVSRKKFIGDILNLAPDKRLEGSLALLVWGVMKGAKLMRVHDVRESKRVVRMAEAVLSSSLPSNDASASRPI